MTRLGALRGLSAAVFLTGWLLPAICGAQIIDLRQAPEGAPTTGIAPNLTPATPPLPGRIDRNGTPERQGTLSDALFAAPPVHVPLRPEDPLFVPGQPVRLSGELQTLSLLLVLPEGAEATTFHLAHRTGIDALPKASSLVVSVNGTTIGTLRPDHFGGFGTDSLPLPFGLLRGGTNTVEINARHTHRIACGPEASFALWTEIDPEASGVTIAAGAFRKEADSFLAAVAAQAAEGRPIRLQRADPDAPLVEQASLIARISSALGGAPVAVASTSHFAIAADTPERARVSVLPDTVGLAEPLIQRGGDGALVITLRASDDLGSMVEALLDRRTPPAVAQPRIVTPGRPFPFSELGDTPLRDEGHYIRLPLSVHLPTDWLVLSAAKARLDLDYRFSAGLVDGAQLLVKINGTAVRLLPILAETESAPQSLPITFEARLLHPGRNEVMFEALIPGPSATANCPPGPLPQIEILRTSRLLVPSSTRMSVPSIARTLAGITPEDLTTTQNAATRLPSGILPQLAAAFGGGNGPQDTTSRGVLTVATIADLDRLNGPVLGAATLDLSVSLSMVEAGLRGTPEATGQSGASVGVSGGVADLPERMWRRIEAARRWTTAAPPPLSEWLAGRMALAALVQPDPRFPEQLWLLLGDRADADETARALHRALLAPSSLSGQVAIYDQDTGWDSWNAPDMPLVLHEPLGMANLREVLGVQASRAPVRFVVALLGLVLAAAALSVAILISTRRKRT